MNLTLWIQNLLYSDKFGINNDNLDFKEIKPIRTKIYLKFISSSVINKPNIEIIYMLMV